MTTTPPKLTDAETILAILDKHFECVDEAYLQRAAADIEAEVRASYEAAGVPHSMRREIVAVVRDIETHAVDKGYGADGGQMQSQAAEKLEKAWHRLDMLLAASPQPEAAPAVAQVPKVSNARPVLYSDEYGHAAAPEAPAQAAPSAGEVERDRKDAERLRTVLEVFGKREDNIPLTNAERCMLAAFDERGSYTIAMKIAAIDAALSHKEQP